MITITSKLEPYDGPSQTIQKLSSSFKQLSAKEFRDKPARMTARQANFYRNLITIAQELQSCAIPVKFELQGIGAVHLDQGCMKIAEHAGFVMPLTDSVTGKVEEVKLSFAVLKQ
ncbi:hypothetical protein CLV80_102230 [Yoonia maritima]|uniref:Uncharacterized protein n=1 Tax=Yoonia maritima TaxID=1435347 RepID=A0A2T0W2Z2_9RHOB|nr:hypothetical protein [Yoonia maritima]PRY79585.1 hypothetical protein CLV80_102230 [Yoonia maritima]